MFWFQNRTRVVRFALIRAASRTRLSARAPTSIEPVLSDVGASKLSHLPLSPCGYPPRPIRSTICLQPEPELSCTQSVRAPTSLSWFTAPKCSRSRDLHPSNRRRTRRTLVCSVVVVRDRRLIDDFGRLCCGANWTVCNGHRTGRRNRPDPIHRSRGEAPACVRAIIDLATVRGNRRTGKSAVLLQRTTPISGSAPCDQCQDECARSGLKLESRFGRFNAPSGAMRSKLITRDLISEPTQGISLRANRIKAQIESGTCRLLSSTALCASDAVDRQRQGSISCKVTKTI